MTSSIGACDPRQVMFTVERLIFKDANALKKYKKGLARTYANWNGKPMLLDKSFSPSESNVKIGFREGNENFIPR